MGSNLVIVAIPDEDDRVWKISSEKVPHLTILHLGDSDKVSNVEQIVRFVEHAVSTSLKRFYLPVDHRGELGDAKADVLFFKKSGYDCKAVRDFRSVLLKDPNIRTAYDATAQFELPEHVGSPGKPWVPHLTLGYPETPAKPEEGEYAYKIYDVCFHKLAVWTGDYDGPEFLLKDYWDECDYALETVPMDVAMSDIHVDPESRSQTAELGAEALEHVGVKGMRWGVRKERPLPVAVAPTATSKVPHGAKRKTKIVTEGGENHPATADAIKVAVAKAKLKKSGTAALSNQELRELQDRMNLERNVAQLVGAQSSSARGRRFVKGLVGANKQINDAANTALTTQQLVRRTAA